VGVVANLYAEDEHWISSAFNRDYVYFSRRYGIDYFPDPTNSFWGMGEIDILKAVNVIGKFPAMNTECLIKPDYPLWGPLTDFKTEIEWIGAYGDNRGNIQSK
jgi:hypothetical protein